MIQRIQTLFLLAAVLLLSALFFRTVPGTSYVVTGITTGISLVTIFLFRRRSIQIRLSVLNTFLLLIYEAVILYCFFTSEVSSFSINTIAPAIAALLTILAKIYISKDEALVRSTSRLR